MPQLSWNARAKPATTHLLPACLPACLAQIPAVERFVVVHGQIILNQFQNYPVEAVRRSAFVTGLREHMQVRWDCWDCSGCFAVLRRAAWRANAYVAQQTLQRQGSSPLTVTRLGGSRPCCYACWCLRAREAGNRQAHASIFN